MGEEGLNSIRNGGLSTSGSLGRVWTLCLRPWAALGDQTGFRPPWTEWQGQRGRPGGNVTAFFSPQRANKGSKVIERLKKKLSEQESLLLLMSPSMAFRVHSRNGKVSAPPAGWLCPVSVPRGLFSRAHRLLGPLPHGWEVAGSPGTQQGRGLVGLCRPCPGHLLF